MTTRFSLAELADMLHAPVEAVRQAVTELSERKELTRESFEFGERNWRIAPTDVKRIQEWVESAQAKTLPASQGTRRVKRKRVVIQDKEADTRPED